MATLDEARAMRIFGDWAPENAAKVGARCASRHLKAPSRALLVRKSQTTGNLYLLRAWTTVNPSGEAMAVTVSRQGNAFLHSGIGAYGVDWFYPPDVPGSDGPDSMTPQAPTIAASNRRWRPTAAPTFGAQPAPAPEPSVVTMDEPEDDDDAEAESEHSFGRLMKGYKQPTPSNDGALQPGLRLPGMQLNVTQARIARQWMARTGLGEGQFVAAAVKHYLGLIQSEAEA